MLSEEEILKNETGAESKEKKTEPEKKLSLEELLTELLELKEAELKARAEKEVAKKEKKEKEEILKGKYYTWEEENLFEDFKLRNDQPYFSDIAAIGDYDVVSVYVNNGLDQPVRLKIFLNKSETTIGGVLLGEEVTIESNSQKAYTITPQTGAWLPFLYVQVKSDIAPTSGALNVKVLKRIPKFELWKAE